MGKFGIRLREARESLGLNKKQFADGIGYSSAHIVELEKGTGRPSKAFIQSLKNAYSINPEYLVNGLDPAFLPSSDLAQNIAGDKYPILKKMGLLKEPSGTYSAEARILEKLRRLSPKDREIIEGLIDRYLELHGQAEAPPPAKKKKASRV